MQLDLMEVSEKHEFGHEIIAFATLTLPKVQLKHRLSDRLKVKQM